MLSPEMIEAEQDEVCHLAGVATCITLADFLRGEIYLAHQINLRRLYVAQRELSVVMEACEISRNQLPASRQLELLGQHPFKQRKRKSVGPILPRYLGDSVSHI